MALCEQSYAGQENSYHVRLRRRLSTQFAAAPGPRRDGSCLWRRPTEESRMNVSLRPGDSKRRISRCAFTLVELLVVIGIIAVLIGILLPALNKAKQQSLKVACSSNMRNAGQAIINYATNNKGKLPGEPANVGIGGAWMWDLTSNMRDNMFVKYGATRDTMYCPVYEDMHKDRLWTYGGFCVSGYLWFLERGSIHNLANDPE